MGTTLLFIMDLTGHSSIPFYDSLEEKEAKRRDSGSSDNSGMYLPKEGW